MKVFAPLKHNVFQEVDIAKPSAMYARVGQRPGSQYSGDDFIPDGNKIDTAQAVIREADKIAQETPDAELGIYPENPVKPE